MFDFKILTCTTVILMVLIYDAKSCDNENLEILQRGVNENDIITIVKEHNKYRKNIMDGLVPGQPRGIGLNYLRWDEKLAEAAQGIANRCIFKHITYVDERWEHKCGQNIYRTEFPYFVKGDKYDYNWTRAIEGWYSEVEQYTYGVIDNKNYKITGHYTQLVWANTELVGCGYVAYDNDKEFLTSNDVALLYVCNYGPSGNHHNQVPYEIA